VRELRASTAIAAAFLLTVAGLIGFGVWSLASGPEEVDIDLLVSDLGQFKIPPGSSSLPIEPTPCSGEGSFPGYAQRRFVVEGAQDDVASDLASQANELGWSSAAADLKGPFVRDGRVLSVGSWESSDEGAGVHLRVETGSPC
jgi:hypothetical protein